MIVLSNKQARYRARLSASGRCSHCGKLCFPYTVCDDRRLYKKFMRILKRMVATGALIRDGNCYSAGLGPLPRTNKIKNNDRRCWPRIGRKSADDESVAALCVSIIREHGEPMSEVQIAAGYAQRARTFSFPPST